MNTIAEKNLTIEVKGVQFVNKGAELMLHAVLQKLSELAPEADIVLRPNKNSPYSERAKLATFQKLGLCRNRLDLNGLTYYLPQGFRNWLKKKWGIVSEADVDVLLDASGFAYGDQWSSIALSQLSKEIARFHKKSKPYVFLPQALGPFSRPHDRKTLSQSLPLARLVMAREESSYKNVSSLGVGKPVLWSYPDFTNIVKGECPDYFNHSGDVFLLIPNSKMLSEKNAQSGWREKYIDLLLESIKLAQARGMRAVMLNHEGDADRRVCDFINENLEVSIEVISEPNPIQVKGIIGQCKLVLCSRFHGCVSALSQGVACIGTSWSYKYERLFEDYDRAEFLLTKPVDYELLDKMIGATQLQQANDNVERIVDLKARSHEMWEHIEKVVIESKSA